jgi:hypothetical protein
VAYIDETNNTLLWLTAIRMSVLINLVPWRVIFVGPGWGTSCHTFGI